MTTPVRNRPLFLAAAALALFGGGFALTLSLAPVPTDAAAGPAVPDRSECQARLVEVERGFGVSVAALRSVAGQDPAHRCVAYRSHVAAIETARSVYAQCLTGFARQDQVAQLELARTDWHATIRSRCSD